MPQIVKSYDWERDKVVLYRDVEKFDLEAHFYRLLTNQYISEGPFYPEDFSMGDALKDPLAEIVKEYVAISTLREG